MFKFAFMRVKIDVVHTMVCSQKLNPLIRAMYCTCIITFLGMITASGFGSRPTSSRSVKTGQATLVSSNDTSLPPVVDNTVDDISRVTSANLLIPPESPVNTLMTESAKKKNVVDSPTLDSIPGK